MAVDTFGHLLALHVTRADKQDREEVGKLCGAVQKQTDRSVELAFVDQGYTGENAEQAAARHKIELMVVKALGAKKGFILLPRRWVVERSFAWLARFRRLVKDYERRPRRSRDCTSPRSPSSCWLDYWISLKVHNTL